MKVCKTTLAEVRLDGLDSKKLRAWSPCVTSKKKLPASYSWAVRYKSQVIGWIGSEDPHKSWCAYDSHGKLIDEGLRFQPAKELIACTFLMETAPAAEIITVNGIKYQRMTDNQDYQS